MNPTNMIVTADELLTLYQSGRKRGFVTGVIFSVAGYYLLRKMDDKNPSSVPFKTE